MSTDEFDTRPDHEAEQLRLIDEFNVAVLGNGVYKTYLQGLDEMARSEKPAQAAATRRSGRAELPLLLVTNPTVHFYGTTESSGYYYLQVNLVKWNPSTRTSLPESMLLIANMGEGGEPLQDSGEFETYFSEDQQLFALDWLVRFRSSGLQVEC